MQECLLDNYIPLQIGERPRILFLFQAASLWPSLETVYRAFVQDKSIDTQLVLVTKQAIEHSQMVSAQKFLDAYGYIYTKQQDFSIGDFRPHVVFVQVPYDLTFHEPKYLAANLRREGYRVVYVPYGIEIADTDTARRDHFQNFVVENAWRIYTCCKSMLLEYKKYCVNRHAVRAFGSPKFDAFANQERWQKKNSAKKTIVWKMHFPKRIKDNGQLVQITPDIMEYITFAKKLDNYSDINFIFLPHPKIIYGIENYDVQNDVALLKEVRELLDILEQQPNVTIYREDEYRPVLQQADAIMLDRSGVMVEAALTGVPILFLEPKDYKEVLTPPILRLVNAFRRGTSCEDMESFLQALLQKNMADYCTYLPIVEQEFSYRDGHCGERIKNDIMRDLPMRPHSKLHLIFYATGRISQYYLFELDWLLDDQYEVIGVVDGNPAKWGKPFGNYTIMPVDSLCEKDYDACIIMSDFYYYEIKHRLVYELHLDERKIWKLDEFIARVVLPA